jgi:hypothetical protein
LRLPDYERRRGVADDQSWPSRLSAPYRGASSDTAIRKIPMSTSIVMG